MGRTRTVIGALLVALTASGAAAVGSAATTPATPYPGGTWSPAPATYGVHAVKHVPVTMSDGARLTVDVYYPADPVTGQRAAGEFPALLTQTPYNGSIGAASHVSQTGPGAYYVTRGYVYVSADVRGTGRSGGIGGFFSPRDAEDGAELVDWVAALDGVNGTVGLHGCSYLGHTQVYTAALLEPGTPVKAMVPACVASDPYRNTYMENGIPSPAWEGAGLLAGTLLGPTIEASMVPKYLESQAGGDTAYYGQFWQDRDHVLDAPAIVAAGIPTLLWNGWNDSGFGGLELYAALQNAHFGRPLLDPLLPGDAVTGRYQLIVGDWSHGGGLDPGIQLQWYETWLKGVDTGLAVDTSTPLHVQERASGRWVNLSSYPMTTSYTPVAFGAGELAWLPPEAEGGALTYSTEPLAGGGTLAGAMGLRVRAASSNTDLQLIADLYDVAPDGTTAHVTHGGVLASMRDLEPAASWSAGGRPVRPYLRLAGETPLTPGESITLDIPLQPTLYRVAPGHRLRLVVAGQASPAKCLDKARAITTSVVGCRARGAVMARLAGGRYTVEGAELNLPLLPLDTPAATRSGQTPTSPVPLPLDW